MRLTGALSNPDKGTSLARLNRLRAKLIAATNASTRSKSALKPRAGAIQATVIEALDSAAGPLKVGEIQTEVEARLGRPISRDTVTSFLSVACRADASRVTRVGPGRYEVREADRMSHAPAD